MPSIPKRLLQQLDECISTAKGSASTLSFRTRTFSLTSTELRMCKWMVISTASHNILRNCHCTIKRENILAPLRGHSNFVAFESVPFPAAPVLVAVVVVTFKILLDNQTTMVKIALSYDTDVDFIDKYKKLQQFLMGRFRHSRKKTKD